MSKCCPFIITSLLIYHSNTRCPIKKSDHVRPVTRLKCSPDEINTRWAPIWPQRCSQKYHRQVRSLSSLPGPKPISPHGIHEGPTQCRIATWQKLEGNLLTFRWNRESPLQDRVQIAKLPLDLNQSSLGNFKRGLSLPNSVPICHASILQLRLKLLCYR